MTKFVEKFLEAGEDIYATAELSLDNQNWAECFPVTANKLVELDGKYYKMKIKVELVPMK